MIPWRRLDSAPMPAASASRGAGAAELTLWQRGDELVIRVGGVELMNSRQHHSEDELGRLACAHFDRGHVARVLIGGLGMGFTLRAVLDAVGPRAEVHVAELCEAVVRWNREVLGELAGHPLSDRRVRVISGDVRRRLGPGAGYDAIILDVDNGPAALSAADNARLYDREGLAHIAASLAPGGALAVWAVADDMAFSKRLRGAGFDVLRHHVRARPDAGATHVITIARQRAVARSAERPDRGRSGRQQRRPRG